MADRSEKFAVVGGGLLGLTLALRLAQRGYTVTLLEAAEQVGGLTSTWHLGDVMWDRHYHVTLLSDIHLRGLLQELALDSAMVWKPTRTGFLVGGKRYSLSSTWEFLRFPPLGLVDKLRLGWTIFHGSRIRDWMPLERIPVADWLIRHSGRRTFERIWRPLLEAKLSGAWQRTNAAFIWATIQRMYAARRTGMKHEMFGYLGGGGYGRLLDAMRATLEQHGAKIRTGCPVEKIERGNSQQFTLTACTGEKFSTDRVVVTTPTPVAAGICALLTVAERQRLQAIEYLGIVCTSVLMRRPLAGFYVTNLTDPAPFTGVIEMTALVDPAELKGQSLIYLPKYAPVDDSIWQRSDAEVEAEFLAALERMYPGFLPADVVAVRTSRVRNVFALPTLNYSQGVPPIHTSVPGMYLVNSAQIVNGTLNVNETVRLAELAADPLCEPLPDIDLLEHGPTRRQPVARP